MGRNQLTCGAVLCLAGFGIVLGKGIRGGIKKKRSPTRRPNEFFKDLFKTTRIGVCKELLQGVQYETILWTRQKMKN